jgi:hypothetical protein
MGTTNSRRGRKVYSVSENYTLLSSRKFYGSKVNMREASVDELLERIAILERERDLAIAHDTQPYPTAWAYEQACKALEKMRQENEINRQAAENGRRKINELNDRVVEFERIKKEHLEYVKILKDEIKDLKETVAAYHNSIYG